MKNAEVQRRLNGYATVHLSLNPWRTFWRSVHYLPMNLAAYLPSVYVEPTRYVRQMTKSGQAEFSELPVPPGVHLWRPPRLLPRQYRYAPLERWAMARRTKALGGVLQRLHCRPILYVWNPGVTDWVKNFEDAYLIYHLADDIPAFDSSESMATAESYLFRRADIVTACSKSLLEAKSHLRDDIKFVPNGVDYESFARLTAPYELVTRISPPRIGYVGFINAKLDFPVLIELAERRPRWSFVFLGPVSPMDESSGEAWLRLLSSRNVYHLPPVSPLEVPAVYASLDCGIIPYLTRGWARFGNPLKLYQFLASGKPVVSSAIDGAVRNPTVVATATTPDSWMEQIEEVLRENSDEQVKERKAVARREDWSCRATQVARLLADLVEQPRTAGMHA